MKDRATLFALSSGAPPAAIAIVRISGPRARRALVLLSGRDDVVPRRARLLALYDPASKELLDRALTLFFPGPDTATGEDLAELHLHGGRAVVAAVLKALGDIEGLVPAEPGAFTRLAFTNGRMDLTQVEGLADLLSAETEAQRRHAILQSEGLLARQALQWRERLIAASASIAALLDFSDEDDVGNALPQAALHAAARVAAAMRQALAVPGAERLRDGVRVVFAGPPNSGKSSLINALTGRDIAIVTAVAGTTRDVLEAPIALDGVALLLTDAAGLRDSDDVVEQEGIARARRAIDNADIILSMTEESDALGRGVVLKLRSKADVRGHPGGWSGDELHVSALDGRGLPALVAAITQHARAIVPPHDALLSNQRQRDCVSTAYASLERIETERDPVLISEHLRGALASLSALVGAVGVEAMLDTLFSRFCIGK